MGIPERNWQGVIDLARSYSAARGALDDVAERIKAYEDEFHEQAERTREKMAVRRSSIEGLVLATVEVIGTEDAEKGKFGDVVDTMNTKFQEIPDSAQHWLALAISEIAITLQAKVAFEAINPLWVEEIHLTDLARLKNEHESHMRSQLWGASSWIETEERFARDFKTLLEVVKGSRRRKVAKTILWPVIALASLGISIVSRFPLAMDLALLPFIILPIGFFFVFLPSLSTGILCGWRIARGKTVAVIFAMFLAPPAFAVLSQIQDWIQGTLSVAELIMMWGLVQILAVLMLSGFLEPYVRALRKQTHSELAKMLDSKADQV